MKRVELQLSLLTILVCTVISQNNIPGEGTISCEGESKTHGFVHLSSEDLGSIHVGTDEERLGGWQQPQRGQYWSDFHEDGALHYIIHEIDENFAEENHPPEARINSLYTLEDEGEENNSIPEIKFNVGGELFSIDRKILENAGQPFFYAILDQNLETYSINR